jgi:hypothetical protein
MDAGDRCHFTAGANTVVVTVREVRDDGLVLVQNRSHGAGAYPFLVRSDTLVPDLEDPVTVDADAV